VAASPARTRLLVVGALDVLLLAGAVGGLVTVDGDDGATPADLSSSAAPAGGTTTTAPAAATTTPSTQAATATTATTKKGTATTATTAAAKGAAASPGGGPPPATATAPRDGSYTSKSTTTGPSGSVDVAVTTTYTTTSRTNGEVRQTVKSKTDRDDPSGVSQGDSEVRWAADGVYQTLHSDAVKCQPPEQLQAKQPLAVGTTWTNKADCKITLPNGVSGTQHTEATYKVLRATTATVGGRTVGAWEISSTTTSHGTFSSPQGSGTNDTKATGTGLFASAFGLTAHQELDTTTTAQGHTFTTHTVIDLQNLDPA
jgi:hypothetical protein